MALDLRPSREPRLTRLELHGFKSFANRTVFAFLPGITAVVGPNGSGKSNIADAIRWVLGEQGSHALRAKKTEDVIFAGGQGRAPASVAEATLVFDNSDRWLPIDFAEVAVTRRAERNGESQYFVNGRRVRLKDVALLTASLGQSHVVVGQGLVDAALSQRPEERRALFEHAADLSGLRLKVAEAERSLNEADGNATRLRDLLTEIEPRLRSMERAARQAREWQGLRGDLDSLQRAHFRTLLLAAVAAHAAAEEGAAVAADLLLAARREVDRLDADGRGGAGATEAARVALAGHDARRGELADRLRRSGHERDLAAERVAALGRRRQDMADTQSGLEEQAAAVAADLAQLATELDRLADQTAAGRIAVGGRQQAGAAARKRRGELEAQAGVANDRIAALDRALQDLARRRALLEQRQETDAAERGRTAAAAAERTARVNALAAELAAAEAALADDAASLRNADARLADRRRDAAAGTARAAEQAEAVTALDREAAAARARFDALRRLHESGAGLFAGVRETLRAARAGELDGVLGTLAELVDVPAAYDTAIEVALGGHLQDVAVRRWADAERAIAHLRRGGAGRATFQPVETVTGGRGGRGPDAALLARPGVHGVAAALVRTGAETRGIVDSLLGRVLVVDDLPAARALLGELPPGWSAVTLGGEIARAGGSVTGGAAVRESGVLGRERDLRTLPDQIAGLEERLATARAELAAREAAARATGEAIRAADAERAARAAAGAERARQRDRVAAWLEGGRREQAAAGARLAELDGRAGSAAADLAAVLDDQERRAGEGRELVAERDRLRTDLTTVLAASAEAEHHAAEAARTLAALEERERAERRREAGLRSQERAVAAELTLRGERAAALDRERETLAGAHAQLGRDAAALDADVAARDAARGPLEAALRGAETAARQLAGTLESARQTALERERATHAADLDLERAQGDLRALLRRVADELDGADPETLLREAQAAEAGEDVPAGADPATREREIARLKERLRRTGYVGEDAVADYEREAAHQTFLREQLADVDEAAAALRELLADLHRSMRLRFDETFARVAAAFAENFAVLFGGGAARLVMTGGDEPGRGDPGIDIVAQPPGKRLQSLALLSGGERALTAAALLFAILHVNPAPFCLLDEVDAALDEANIVRVRERLRALADQTQVVVVTHNRGTIEIADTLYGVSMGADGVSQVLSLRLEA